jgi:DNA-binding HxlR family transcriptional regulator
MKIKNKEIQVEVNGEYFHCAMDVSMKYLGGKWKSVVLWYLKDEKKRFAELNKLIPQMTERMLSITLKQLEEDGLVLREVYASKPPLKVEYSLTKFGRTCLPLLEELSKWGRFVGKSKGKLVEI